MTSCSSLHFLKAFPLLPDQPRVKVDTCRAGWILPGRCQGRSWGMTLPAGTYPAAPTSRHSGTCVYSAQLTPKAGGFATLFFYHSNNFSNLAGADFLYLLWFGF